VDDKTSRQHNSTRLSVKEHIHTDGTDV